MGTRGFTASSQKYIIKENFKNGNLNGYSKTFYPNGDVDEEIFENRQVVYRVWFTQGQIEYSGGVENDFKHWEGVTYDENGERFTGNYEQGNIQGYGVYEENGGACYVNCGRQIGGEYVGRYRKEDRKWDFYFRRKCG
jgi:antitoxin component YwqK of YwqJK toxin-antitoxin module